MIPQVTRARLPTAVGEFQLHLFASAAGGNDHLALVHGEVAGRSGPACRT